MKLVDVHIREDGGVTLKSKGQNTIQSECGQTILIDGLVLRFDAEETEMIRAALTGADKRVMSTEEVEAYGRAYHPEDYRPGGRSAGGR